jgi:hypothetical protein
VPPQYPGAPTGPGYGGDPLVPPMGASFGAWFNKVVEIGKRSWKSALITAGAGVAVPYAIAGLAAGITGWQSGWWVFNMGATFNAIGDNPGGIMLALVISVAGCFIAAGGWAAGAWAVIQEAATGQPADLNRAARYGLRRATALFPWTVVAAAAYTVAGMCLWLPSVYLAYGFAFFGLVALFERGQNPVKRSFSLTHNSTTFGQTLARLGVLIAAASVYLGLVRAVEGVLHVIVNAAGANGPGLGHGMIEFLGGLFAAPIFALLLIGLLPAYAELRARETPMTTSRLQQELGG